MLTYRTGTPFTLFSLTPTNSGAQVRLSEKKPTKCGALVIVVYDYLWWKTRSLELCCIIVTLFELVWKRCHNVLEVAP
jgi:hypothetical protein